MTKEPRQPAGGTRIAPADALLEQAAELLTRTAIQMALGGDPFALRHCLNRLSALQSERPIAFTLPEIGAAADLPKATRALLGAIAAGEITPARAATIGKLVKTHIEAIEAADFDARLDLIEEAQGQ